MSAAMKTSDFDYPLPSQLIAQTPVEPRDHSRLLVLHRQDGTIEHHRFWEIADFLRPGDMLVCNDSRVIPARLWGRKPSGAKIEILLLHREEQDLWETLARPARRVRRGDRIEIGFHSKGESLSSSSACLIAEVVEQREGALRLIRFSQESWLEKLGEMPLPPYIHIPLSDPERYQTVYARVKGSVAAPTAGLHFTPELLRKLEGKGVELVFVTLHIGLDTFRPVRNEYPYQHAIHQEYGELSEGAARRLTLARKEGRRIISTGTTTVRILEQAALASGEGGVVKPFQGWTELFILPGHRFHLADALITNFHLPRSTLLMLVCAFAGRELVLRAYQEAINLGYRFYSFGDAMLIL